MNGMSEMDKYMEAISRRRQRKTKWAPIPNDLLQTLFSSDSSSSSLSAGAHLVKKEKANTRNRSRSRSNSSIDSETDMKYEDVKKKREIENLTRDARTVFVTQLQAKATQTDLKKFFKTVCKVKDVVMLLDKRTGRSKGSAYVEVASLDDVPKALMLDNIPFVFRDGGIGFPIRVKASEAEKNFTHQLEKKAARGMDTSKDVELLRQANLSIEPPFTRIYVSNLHPSLGEPEIRQLFEPFGEILVINLQVDMVTRESQGYCFIKYAEHESAVRAIKEVNGKEILGLKIKMNKAKDINTISPNQVFGLSTTIVPVVSGNTIADGSTASNSTDENGSNVVMTMFGAPGVPAPSAPNPGRPFMNRNTYERRNNSYSINSYGKSFGNASSTSTAATSTNTTTNSWNPNVEGVPSRFVLLSNMFDPSTETEPEWENDVKEDTIEECSKFGKVLNCKVDKESKSGMVYV